jgi:transcriptional regulator with XRE-family HTH domain
MNQRYPASYLRSHRKRSGLSQMELAALLGYPNEGPVSRHERLYSTPPFRIALGYEVIFGVPASELFPATFEEISQYVEVRLKMLRSQLEDSTAKGRSAILIARKLEWMLERQNPEQSATPNETRLQ